MEKKFKDWKSANRALNRIVKQQVGDSADKAWKLFDFYLIQKENGFEFGSNNFGWSYEKNVNTYSELRDAVIDCFYVNLSCFDGVKVSDYDFGFITTLDCVAADFGILLDIVWDIKREIA